MSLLSLIQTETEIYELAVADLVQEWLEAEALCEVGDQFEYAGEICTVECIKLLREIFEYSTEPDTEEDIIYLIDIPSLGFTDYPDWRVCWPQKVLRPVLVENLPFRK